MLLRHLSSPRLPLLIAALFAGGFVLLSACDSGGSGPPDGDDPEPPNRAPSVTAGATVASDSARLTAEASDPDGNLAALRLTGREGDFAVEAASVDSTAAIDTTVALDRFPLGVATIGAEATDEKGAAASDTARFAHEPDSLRVGGGPIEDVFTGDPVAGVVEVSGTDGERLHRVETGADGMYGGFSVPHLEALVVEVFGGSGATYTVRDTLRPGRFVTEADIVDDVGGFGWLEQYGIDPGELALHALSVNDDSNPRTKSFDWSETEVFIYRRTPDKDDEGVFLQREMEAFADDYRMSDDDIVRFTGGRELPVHFTDVDSSNAPHSYHQFDRLVFPDNTIAVMPMDSTSNAVGANVSKDIDEDDFIEYGMIRINPAVLGGGERVSGVSLDNVHSQEFGQTAFDLGEDSDAYDAHRTLYSPGALIGGPSREDQAISILYNAYTGLGVTGKYVLMR
jgi:hypothetical protein